MESIFIILFACIESGFLSIAFIQKWSEKLISASNCPQDWLIELTSCIDEKSALNILRRCVVHYGVMFDEVYGKILIGFLYLNFKAGNLSSEQFIKEIIDIADAYEVVELDSESIRVESGEIKVSKDRTLHILEEWSACSQENYEYLTSQELYENEKRLIEQA